jgi:hypothetical protein
MSFLWVRCRALGWADTKTSPRNDSAHLLDTAAREESYFKFCLMLSPYLSYYSRLAVKCKGRALARLLGSHAIENLERGLIVFSSLFVSKLKSIGES